MKTYGELRYHEGTFDQRGSWLIRAEPDVMLRLKRILPKASTSRTAAILLWDYPDTCRDLEWVLFRWPLDMDAATRERLEAGAAEQRQIEERATAILTGGQPHLDLIEPARAAREYQLVAADLALTTRSLLLADDLGLGKSMSGLLVLREQGALPALIVCPTHLPRQWESELVKTLPWLRSHVIRGMRPYDPAKSRGMRGHDPDVLIVNYHKLRGWVDHLAGRVNTVIFDEAQELRRADSEKWKAAARIADSATYKVGLTATPIYNYGGEIFNVMSVLSPDALGNREEFAREWGTSPYFHDKLQIADPKALGASLRDRGLMLRRRRFDVGRELPEVVRVTHTIDADEKVHDELMAGTLDLAQTILAGERRKAFLAAGELDYQMRQATGIAKAPFVAEFVNMTLEAERKVILFGWHRAVYDIWLDRLAGHNPVMYTGSESPNQKAAAREQFVEDDECRVFVMSLRSGAGLDGLQEVSNVAVFGELDWSPGMHDQCIGRLHRDGQDDSVVAYFLVSDIGSDPVIADVLGVKRMQAEPFRDPDLELFETTEDNSNRVRKLAEQVLAKRRAAA